MSHIPDCAPYEDMRQTPETSAMKKRLLRRAACSVLLLGALGCYGCIEQIGNVLRPLDRDAGGTATDSGIAVVDAAGGTPADLRTPRTLTPVPPNAASFGWQGLQRQFKDADGSTCTGAVTIAMGDQAVCFVAADDSLRCAGRVYMKTFGSRFVDTGQRQVDQILLSSTFNIEGGNQMCIHKTGGIVMCMGYGNVIKAADFTRWGAKTDWSAIGTGTFDELCGIDSAGQVYCSGFRLGDTPLVQDGGRGHVTFWQSNSGTMHFDEVNVFRVSAGRAECQVGITGLRCPRTLFGLPGTVVDGSIIRSMNFGTMEDACWLTQDGKVSCMRFDMNDMGRLESAFTGGTVLALAANFYTDSMCAVFSDGSLHCVGSNSQGKLGTGDTRALSTETMVQPPGTVRIDCR